MHSERCFWWRYFRRLVRKQASVELDRGECVHSALQYAYELGDVDDAFAALRADGGVGECLDRLQTVGDWFTLDRLYMSLDKYRERLAADMEQFEVVSAEQDVDEPICEGVTWGAVIDLTLRDKTDGKIYYIDHKTSEKKVDSPDYVSRFNNDMQFTSYDWLGHLKHGKDFGGILINALQATKTIPFRHSRFALTRDTWQTDEWLGTIRVHAPRIKEAYDKGTILLEQGLDETHPDVLEIFPVRYSYSENYCDFKYLNNEPPELREALIEQLYATREESGRQ